MIKFSQEIQIRTQQGDQVRGGPRAEEGIILNLFFAVWDHYQKKKKMANTWGEIVHKNDRTIPHINSYFVSFSIFYKQHILYKT